LLTLHVIDCLLGFFGIQAISGDVPFILPVEEAVLPSGFLACVLDFVPRSALVASAVVLLVLRPIILVRLLLVVLGRLLIFYGS
jgi:hypothetical protein